MLGGAERGLFEDDIGGGKISPRNHNPCFTNPRTKRPDHVATAMCQFCSGVEGVRRARQVTKLAHTMAATQQRSDDHLALLLRMHMRQHRVIHVGCKRPLCIQVEGARVGHESRCYRMHVTAPRSNKRGERARENRTRRHALRHLLQARLH